MTGKTYIGHPLKRVDAEGKVTGETKFLTDIYYAGMVFSSPVYSSIPFGRIKSVDLSLVSNKKGYIDFISAVDIPGENQVGVIQPDQPLFADKTVRYIGDTIGLIIADSQETARRLAGQVKVTYVEYEPVFSIRDSKHANHRTIHDSNISCSHRVCKGDIELGFKEADKIITGEFTTPAQEHYYLEPQGCIAFPPEDRRIRILGSLQCPFYVQKAVAKVLAIPYSMVIVEQAPTGGAFGGKEDVPSELCARTALAAVKTGRPVKMVYDRREDIQLTSKRHPFKMKYKVGVNSFGKLTAADVVLEENSGAYATLSSVVSYRSSIQAMGPYKVANVRVQSNSYYTNLPPNGAFRGFGSPQAAFGHERMMDIIAEKLGMDPVKLRKINVIKAGDETITGQKLFSSVSAKDTLVAACKDSDWKIPGVHRPEIETRYKTGYGVALTHYGNCLGAAGWFMDGAGVKVKIHRDGSVTVAFGLVEMGQGAITAVTQMTAEAFGFDPARITVSSTNTEQVPDSGPAVASRNVVMTGQAIRDAAEKLLPEIHRGVAEYWHCPVEQVKIVKDHAINNITGESCSFPKVAELMYLSNCRMDTTGWWHVPPLQFDPENGIGEAYFTYSYAAHLAKVVVDTCTGQIKVRKVWAAHDVGTAVNPAGIEGQVEGGIAQGGGWAVTENLKTSEGSVTSNNLTTYLLPTAEDIPDIETKIIENPDPNGPWGAKGIGEPSIIPAGAAVANAVSHAIGRQVCHLPMTPEYILNLIDDMKGN